VDIANRIAEVLAPHLGGVSADAISQHLCARAGLVEGAPIDPAARDSLREELRIGLVPFVGAPLADELARVCVPADEDP
jgi:hypothetical protein